MAKHNREIGRETYPIAVFIGLVIEITAVAFCTKMYMECLTS